MEKKEAMKILKEFHDKSALFSVRTALDTIIPELKDSEDERVRNEIIDYLKSFVPHHDDDLVAKSKVWIAWLEKQREKVIDCPQNHQDVTPPNGCIVLEDFNGGEGFYKLNLDYLDKKQVEEIEKIVIAWNKDATFSDFEKQGDQKSVWNEEDEKMFNSALWHVKNSCSNGGKNSGEFEVYNWLKSLKVKCKDVVEYGKTGLEKRDEQKPTKNIMNVWKEMRFEVYQQASGNRHEPNYSDDTTKLFSLNDIDEIIEKISDATVEQKPADKVEPKFNIGDWVVSPNGVYWHIDAIQNGRYQVSSDSGTCADWPLNTNIYHKFTIRDAKDGDMLYECNEEMPFIFKELKTKHIDDIASYCDIFNGIFNPNEDNWTTLDIVPATKEQRDELEKAIMESGYEWNPEKKELKKIDYKWVDLGLPSGTLWKSFNEIGFFTYDEAVNDFGDKLPTKEQFEELKAKCNWEWKGNGCKVKGPNGNYIFMPAAGYRYGKDIIAKLGTFGYYWSLTPDDSDNAWALYIYSTEEGMYNNYRSYGQSVRLVKNKQ